VVILSDIDVSCGTHVNQVSIGIIVSDRNVS